MRHNELAAGLVNGVNTTFATFTPFVPGSLIALVNGLAQIPIEAGPTGFTIDLPPDIGSTVSVRYDSA